MIHAVKEFINRPVFRDAIFYSLAGAASALTPLALLPLLTRKLSVDEYAFFVLISSAIGLLVPFIGFGAVNAVVVRYFSLGVKELRVYLSSVFRVLVFSGICFILIGIYFRETLASFFHPGLGAFIFSVLMAVVFSAGLMFASLYISAVNAGGYFRVYIIYGATLFFSTALFCGVMDYGLLGACIGMACAYTAFTGAAYFGSSVTKLDRAWSQRDAKDALVFGFPLMIHSAAIVLIGFSDRFAVSRWVAVEAVASYGVTVQLALVVGFFFHAVNKVIQPRIYSLLKLGGAHPQRQAISYAYMYCFSVVSVAVLYAIAFPFVVELLAGAQYTVAPKVYCFIILGSAFNSMYLVFTHFVFFRGRTFHISFVTMASALGYMLLLFLLAPRFGLEGIALAYAMTNGVMLMLTAFLARICTDVRWLDRSLLRLFNI